MGACCLLNREYHRYPSSNPLCLREGDAYRIKIQLVDSSQQHSPVHLIHRARITYHILIFNESITHEVNEDWVRETTNQKNRQRRVSKVDTISQWCHICVHLVDLMQISEWKLWTSDMEIDSWISWINKKSSAKILRKNKTSPTL